MINSRLFLRLVLGKKNLVGPGMPIQVPPGASGSTTKRKVTDGRITRQFLTDESDCHVELPVLGECRKSGSTTEIDGCQSSSLTLEKTACVALLTPTLSGLWLYELSWGSARSEEHSMQKISIPIFVATVGLALLICLIAP